MDEEDTAVAQWTGVVKVHNNITQSPRGITTLGALDKVDLRALRNGKRIIIDSGAKMALMVKNGRYLRTMMIVVRTFYSFVIAGMIKLYGAIHYF